MNQHKPIILPVSTVAALQIGFYNALVGSIQGKDINGLYHIDMEQIKNSLSEAMKVQLEIADIKNIRLKEK